MVTPTNHVLAGPDLHIALGSWHFGDFRNIFLPNVGEDQKKSYDLIAVPLASTVSHHGKSGPG